MSKQEKTISIELYEKELRHLINDTVARIYRIKELVFGDNWNFGTDITEIKELTAKQKEELTSLGYYSRKEFLDKLLQLEKDNFKELNCCE